MPTMVGPEPRLLPRGSPPWGANPNLCLRQFTIHPPDPPLVDGSQMVNQSEGSLSEATRAGCKRGGIEALHPEYP